MENKTKKPHTLTMENRIKTTVTGIEKVLNSCDTSLNLISSEGAINITGKELKIEQFSVLEGVLTFTGTVNSVKYTAAKTPVLKKLFK